MPCPRCKNLFPTATPVSLQIQIGGRLLHKCQHCNIVYDWTIDDGFHEWKGADENTCLRCNILSASTPLKRIVFGGRPGYECTACGRRYAEAFVKTALNLWPSMYEESAPDPKCRNCTPLTAKSKLKQIEVPSRKRDPQYQCIYCGKVIEYPELKETWENEPEAIATDGTSSKEPKKSNERMPIVNPELTPLARGFVSILIFLGSFMLFSVLTNLFLGAPLKQIMDTIIGYGTDLPTLIDHINQYAICMSTGLLGGAAITWLINASEGDLGNRTNIRIFTGLSIVATLLAYFVFYA